MRGETVDLAITKKDLHIFRFAQSARRFDQRIEHHLKIERRAADDLKHVGSGGLLLEAIHASSLSRRVFSMAMTAWAAKASTSATCLSVNGLTSNL